MIPQLMDRKLIHLINEAERDFPFSSKIIYFLEQDESKTHKI